MKLKEVILRALAKKIRAIKAWADAGKAKQISKMKEDQR